MPEIRKCNQIKTKMQKTIIKTPFEKAQYNLTLLFFVFSLVLIPLFSLPNLIDPVLLSRFTLLSVGLLVFILTYVYFILKFKASISLTYLKKLVFIALLIVAIFSGLSIFNAINYSEAVFSFIKETTFFVYFIFSAILLFNSKITEKTIAKVIVVFSVLILIIGLFQTLDVIAQGGITKGSASGIKAVFMNKNLYAQILFLTLPFNLFGFLTFSKKWKSLAAINSLLTLFLIVVLHTRAVWLALFVSVIISLLFTAIYNYKSTNKLFSFNKKIKRSIYVVVGTIFISLVIITLSEGSIIPKFMTDKKFTTSEGRIAMWEKSAEMASDYPILGVGGGNWKIRIPEYGVYDEWKVTGKKRVQRAHNDYLTILTENGFFALLAFVSALLLSLFYLVKIIKKTEERDIKIFYFLLFFGIIGFMVFSFFDFPRERIEHNIYFYSILAIIVTKYYNLNNDDSKQVSNTKLLIFTFPILIFLFAASYFGVIKIKAESGTRLATDALHSNRFKTTISEINNSYSWFYEMDPTATPLLWYKGLANFRLENSKEALSNFLMAAEINPFHSHTFNSIGIIYAGNGDFAKAKEYFQRSLNLQPYSTETIINLARIYLQNDNYDEAYIILKRINPNYNNGQFKINMVMALDYKLDKLADSIGDSKVSEYVIQSKKLKPKTLEIYKTAVLEHRSFDSQFLHSMAEDLFLNDTTLNENEINKLNGFLLSESIEEQNEDY